MNSIFVVFSRPVGLFKPYAWLIMLWERTLFSHVAIKFKPPFAQNYVVFQASGLHVNMFAEKEFSKMAHVVREFKFELDQDSFAAFLAWVYKMVGRPYGTKSVLGIPLQKVFNLKRNPFSDGRQSWFCSELVARALNKFTGVFFKREEFELAGPRKILELCEMLGREIKNGR